MLEAFKWFHSFKELREGLGLPMQLITDSMMAYAQADADWSDVSGGHAREELHDTAENLAYNYGSDPFLQLYYEEKGNYDRLNNKEWG